VEAAVGALATVFRDRDLRRLELAWTASISGEFAYAVALAVYAYDQGGATAVGIAGLVRLVPSAIAAPFVAGLADRFPRRRVMLAGHLFRGGATALTAAAVVAGSPAAVVYALATAVAVASTAFWPAQAASLPELASTPEELTAANAASATLETVGSFAGPAFAGVMLAGTGGTEALFAATAVIFGLAAVQVAGIRAAPAPAAEGGSDGDGVLAGLRLVVRDRRLRLVVGLYGTQALVTGMLNVLIVALALELLGLDESAVGFLAAAVGVGGVVGTFAAISLLGSGRLARAFVLGLVLWAAPIALIALRPDVGSTALLLGVLGIGATIVDVAALGLMQRSVPERVLARACGVVEGLWAGALGVGSILAPALIAVLGVRGALAVAGSVLPVLAALAWRRLRAVDEAPGVPAVVLLRRVSILAPLSQSTLESLASQAAVRRAEAGEAVVRQGDRRDCFYVVAAGALEVAVDGASVRRLGPDDFFGEIALLRRVPRTATVTATEATELLALDGDDFVAAVTGHAESAAAAEAVVGARLGSLRRGTRNL
jgi:MFS family permease